MDWKEFQPLLDKAFQREPALEDWLREREKWDAVNAMILEVLDEPEPLPEVDVWA